MKVPDDLPPLVEYRIGPWVRGGPCILMRALPRHPIVTYGSSGRTNCSEICPRIPPGANAWRINPGDPWKLMNTIPKHWMPYLNRERGTEMDPRPPHDDNKHKRGKAHK